MRSELFNKVLAMLLVVMMFCLLPLSGFADVDFNGLKIFKNFSLEVEAESFTEGNFTYTVSNDEAVLTGCVDVTGDIIIPSMLGGYPVTVIDDSAFSGCGNVGMLSIPSSVTSISLTALSDCTSLIYVSVDSDNLNYSSDGYGVLFNKDKTALLHCPQEKTGSYTIPDTVTNVEASAFVYCSELTSICVDSDNANYSNDEQGVLFNKDKTIIVRCPGAKSGEYVIPDGVISISSSAFKRCDNLTSIVIPESVTTIESSSFLYCADLVSICVNSDNQNYSSDEYGVLFDKDKINLIRYPGSKTGDYIVPEGVNEINSSAFENCRDITAVDIPDSVTSIGSSAFSGCNNLFNVSMSNNITTIHPYTFENCTSLVSIKIPDAVTDIGAFAFNRCSGLKELSIPVSAKIRNNLYTFGNCKNIEKIILTKGTGVMIDYKNILIASYTFTPWYISDCSEIIIEEGVENISAQAFRNCENLVTITIPESVKTIDKQAFSGCSNIKNVYYMGTQADFNKIIIRAENDSFLNANIHFLGIHKHTYVLTSHRDATCISPGEELYLCSCGSYYIEEIPCLSHIRGNSIEENFVEATCTSGATLDIVTYCMMCGSEFSREKATVSAALGHKEVIDEAKESTCTEIGLTSGKHCFVCGVIIVIQESVAAKGHDYVSTIIPPTAVNQGYTMHMCEACGDLYKDNYTSPTGFEITGKVASFCKESDVVMLSLSQKNQNKVLASIVVDKNIDTYTFDKIEQGEYILTVSKNNHITRLYEVAVIDNDLELDVQLNLIGDINGDGKITVIDYTQLLKHVKKTSSLEGYDFDCADVNGDGKLTVIDYTRLLKHVKKTEMLW